MAYVEYLGITSYLQNGVYESRKIVVASFVETGKEKIQICYVQSNKMETPNPLLCAIFPPQREETQLLLLQVPRKFKVSGSPTTNF